MRLLPLALVTLTALTACGANEANVAAYCSTSCSKFTECGFTQFVSEETCVESCETQTEADDCQPSQAEADACLSAIEAATCDELRDGNPPECQLTCDDETDDTTETDANMGGGGGGGGAAPSCVALQACCDTLDGGEKIGCEAIVDTNTELGCSVALQGFIDEGICPE